MLGQRSTHLASWVLVPVEQGFNLKLHELFALLGIGIEETYAGIGIPASCTGLKNAGSVPASLVFFSPVPD